MSILTTLLILILSARILGGIAEKYGQPPIMGEMLAGILLGPSAFNLISASDALSGISALAVFLMCSAPALRWISKKSQSYFEARGLSPL